MAGASISSLNVDLSIGTARYKKGLDEAQRQLAGFQAKVAGIGSKMQGFGTALSVGLTAPLVALGAKSIQAANESKAAFAQVETALGSMGGASGRTATQLQELAGRLQDTSLFDDDDILAKSTANLLTFGKINGEIFDRAQQAIVDYAARTGTDLQPATIMIGKALNDPVKGLTALSKVGVQFTADQKKMIEGMVESGNVAGAQKLILAELEKQYKGSGKAARDASPTAETEQAWRTFQETLGAIAVKILPPITSALTGVLNAFNKLDPATQQFVAVAGAFGIALGPVIGTLGTLVKGFAAVAPVAMAAGRALLAVAVAGGPLTVIALAVGAVYLAWKNWDKIAPILRNLYVAAKTWLSDKLGAVFDWVKGKLQAVGDWFYNLYDRVVGHSYVPDMVDGIGAQMARLSGNMVEPARKATKAVGDSFKALRDELAPLLDELFPAEAAQNALNKNLALIERARKLGASKGGLSDAQAAEASRRLRTGQRQSAEATIAETMGGGPIILPLLSDLPELQRKEEDFAALLDRLDGKSKSTSDVMRRNFADMAEGVVGSLDNMVRSLKGGGIMGALSGILDFALQLGSIGAFGKRIAANINAPRIDGARALGGPVSAGKSYLVGERGPEMFTASRSGYITPNNKMGSGSGRPVSFDLRGAVMTADLLQQMSVIATQTGGAIVTDYARGTEKRNLRALA